MEESTYGYENINTGQGRQFVDRWHANVLCLLCAMLTFCLRYILTWIGKPKFVKEKIKFTLWRNILISWLHGVIVGPWAFLCIWWYPEQLDNPASYVNECLYTMVPVSIGYFVYDFIDILLTTKFSEDIAIKIHHVFIISGMPFCWNSYSCVSYCAILLLGEMNSAFLHLRKLLQFTHIGFDSLLYRTVSMLSLLTFVVFRIMPQFRTLMGFYIDYNNIPRDVYIAMLSVLPGGAVINIGLFWHLVQADIINSTFGLRRQKKNKHS